MVYTMFDYVKNLYHHLLCFVQSDLSPAHFPFNKLSRLEHNRILVFGKQINRKIPCVFKHVLRSESTPLQQRHGLVDFTVVDLVVVGSVGFGDPLVLVKSVNFLLWFFLWLVLRSKLSDLANEQFTILRQCVFEKDHLSL